MSYQDERKAWVAEITEAGIQEYEDSKRSWLEEDTDDMAHMIAGYAVPDNRSERVALCARLGLTPFAGVPSVLIYNAAYEGAMALLMAERWERGE